MRIPSPHFDRIRLSKSIAALQIRPFEGDKEQKAFLTQIPKGAELQVCGNGFTARTRRVESGGNLYFVFLQDIEEAEGLAVLS